MTDNYHALLAANAHALAQARENAALYERLKGAAAEVKRLQKEGDALTASLSDHLAADDAAAVLAVEKTHRNFRIGVKALENDGAVSPTRSRVTISYERLRYNMNSRENDWVREEVGDFRHLDVIVLRYLIKHKVEAIPAFILNLADNPEKALDRYLIGLGRNYV